MKKLNTLLLCAETWCKKKRLIENRSAQEQCCCTGRNLIAYCISIISIVQPHNWPINAERRRRRDSASGSRSHTWARVENSRERSRIRAERARGLLFFPPSRAVLRKTRARNARPENLIHDPTHDSEFPRRFIVMLDPRGRNVAQATSSSRRTVVINTRAFTRRIRAGTYLCIVRALNALRSSWIIYVIVTAARCREKTDHRDAIYTKWTANRSKSCIFLKIAIHLIDYF